MDEKKNSKPSIKKSALYVDVEDDLTTIISKIKDSSGKVVALVPPKRVGILQSAVNLKLLKKTADKQKKDLILVSTDKTLGTLAAGAGIPVARNLTAEAKLMDLPEDFDDEEFITGLDQVSKKSEEKSREDAAVEAVADDDKIRPDEKDSDLEDDFAPKKSKKSKKLAIPNISKFRRWIILGVVALLALIAFIVWAVFFSTMTITISAKTSEEKIDQAVTLEIDGQTVPEESKLRAVAVRNDSNTREIEFTPTGKKDVSERATGRVRFQGYCVESDTSIPAGTIITAGGLQFRTTSSVVVGATSMSGCLSGKATTSAAAQVEAVATGEQYNGVSGSASSRFDKEAHGYNFIAVAFDGSTSGGVNKIITVVQQSDIDHVVDKIRGDTGNDSNAKTEMLKKFASDVVPVESSFKVDIADIKSSPAVDQEAKSAKVSLRIVYTMYGIPKTDLSNMLMFASTNKLSNKTNQTVFDDGVNDVKFESYNPGNNSLRLVTTAKIGPKVVDEEIKANAVGKKSQEIKASIEGVEGIEEVRVDMPFWMSVAPEENRIKIVKSGL